MSRATQELLHDALSHLHQMQTYASHDLEDQMVIDASCLRLSAALEVLHRLDDGTRDALFGDEWPIMWGIRNRIVHGYLLVDSAIIRRTLESDVPRLVSRIATALD